MSPRSEPLLWVQLINGGALPLEALLLLLLLAGADPGPLPALERLLAWALGAATPALLLWQRPADPRSVLLLRGAPDANPDLEQTFSALPQQNLPRWAFAIGVIGLLPLLGWLDGTAALASQLSPLAGAGRLSCLMAGAGLMALMVWQWQQLVQVLWLLSRNPTDLPSHSPQTQQSQDHGQTRLGLPLLRLAPLRWPEPRTVGTFPVATDPGPSQQFAAEIEPLRPESTDPLQPDRAQADESAEPAGDSEAATVPDDRDPDASEPGVIDAEGVASGAIEPELVAPDVDSDGEVFDPEVIDPLAAQPQPIAMDPAPLGGEAAEAEPPLDSAGALAIEPEQAPEQEQGHDLDQQVS